MQSYDLIIIGAGPAGMAAALEAHNAGIKKLIMFEREEFLGGILMQCIHNGFGIHEFKEELTGPEFAQRFIDDVKRLNIPYRLGATVVDISKDRIVTVMSKEGYEKIHAKAVLFATGSSERPRGAISIPGTRPTGVITAGAAQKFLNMEGYLVGKKVFILGSGDIGLIMARRMTLEGAKVLGVAEIMPYSNGLTRNIVQCLNDFDIPLYLSHTVTQIYGRDRVEKIDVTKVDESFNPIEGTTMQFEVDTLMLSVGLRPDMAMGEYLNMNLSRAGGPTVTNLYETSIDGVFACGNCLHIHDIVDYVVQEARTSIKGIKKYLNDKHKGSDFLASVEAKDGISYVVPQYIDDKFLDEKQRFYFRVNKATNLGKIDVSVDGKLVKSFNKANLLPAEMELVEVDSNLLKDGKKIELSLLER